MVGWTEADLDGSFVVGARLPWYLPQIPNGWKRCDGSRVEDPTSAMEGVVVPVFEDHIIKLRERMSPLIQLALMAG